MRQRKKGGCDTLLCQLQEVISTSDRVMLKYSRMNNLLASPKFDTSMEGTSYILSYKEEEDKCKYILKKVGIIRELP